VTSRGRHKRSDRAWSSDVCSSDLDRWGGAASRDWLGFAARRHGPEGEPNEDDDRDGHGKDARPLAPGQAEEAILHPEEVREDARSEERRVGKGGSSTRWL